MATNPIRKHTKTIGINMNMKMVGELDRCTLQETIEINKTLLAWFKRLSDTLFVLARLAANFFGNDDEVWVNPKEG